MATAYRTVRLGMVDYAERKRRVAEFEGGGWSVFGISEVFGHTTLNMATATPDFREWRERERELAGLPAPALHQADGLCVGCEYALLRHIPHGPHGYAVSTAEPVETTVMGDPATAPILPLDPVTFNPIPAAAAKFWFGG